MPDTSKGWLDYYRAAGGTGAGVTPERWQQMHNAYLASQPAGSFAGAASGAAGLPAYQAGAGTANLAALPGLEELSRQVNEFNLGQRTAQLTAGLPQYNQMLAQSSANIAANLAGQVPVDVQNLLKSQGAERAVGQGMPAGTFGSTMPTYDLLRTLGLTSLQQQQQGEQQLTNAIARTPQTPIYSPTEGFITPAQTAQYDLQAASLANRGTGAGRYPTYTYPHVTESKPAATTGSSMFGTDTETPAYTSPSYGGSSLTGYGSPWSTAEPSTDWLSYLTTPFSTDTTSSPVASQPSWVDTTDQFWGGVLGGLTDSGSGSIDQYIDDYLNWE